MLYQLTEDAEQDLREIAEYTLNRWGRSQLIQYQQGFTRAIERIVEHPSIGKRFSEKYPEIKTHKYQQHLIFYFAESPIIILAVIHEKMDAVRYLQQRL